MVTPYVTPQLLLQAPTGIAWSTIPDRNSTAEQQAAEQMNICMRATAEADRICNQVLRATADPETQAGPDYRLTVDSIGVGRLILPRWPVLSVVSARMSPSAAFPPNWQDLPSDAVRVENPPNGVPDNAGAGSAVVLISPYYINWFNGRRGWTVEVTYLNGWPHTSLTAESTAGATSLAVDDVTGWTGITGTVFDGAGTERISVVSVTPLVEGGDTPTGPGQLNLASPTADAHAAGVLVTTMPENIQWATIMLATAQALTRGATATTTQSLPGARTSMGGGDAAGLRAAAADILGDYARVI